MAHQHLTGTDAEAYRLSIIASERLRTALHQHGMEFPSVRGTYPSRGEPTVELGRVSATVVHTLAAALEELAGGLPGPEEVTSG